MNAISTFIRFCGSTKAGSPGQWHDHHNSGQFPAKCGRLHSFRCPLDCEPALNQAKFFFCARWTTRPGDPGTTGSVSAHSRIRGGFSGLSGFFFERYCGTTESAIAGRVFRQILLMIVLRIKEFTRCQNFCCDRIVTGVV